MLINVVIKKTAEGTLIGWNVLIHDTTNEDAKYIMKTQIELYDGVAIHIGATENRLDKFIPVVRYIKENLDILEKTECTFDTFAKLLAAMLGSEFKCTARAAER